MYKFSTVLTVVVAAFSFPFATPTEEEVKEKLGNVDLPGILNPLKGDGVVLLLPGIVKLELVDCVEVLLWVLVTGTDSVVLLSMSFSGSCTTDDCELSQELDSKEEGWKDFADDLGELLSWESVMEFGLQNTNRYHPVCYYCYDSALIFTRMRPYVFSWSDWPNLSSISAKYFL